MVRLIDLTGQKFGRLTVIERSNIKKDRTAAVWKCQCDCGNETIVSGIRLRSSNTKSCGCLFSENIAIYGKMQNDNPSARKNNKSTGIKNISYVPTHGFTCYRVAIVRDKREYCQYFTTLKDAERSKEYVLSRYKKGISNWNDKL